MGKGVDTFKRRAKEAVKESPRQGSGVVRFNVITAALPVFVYAYLPDQMGSLDKVTDVEQYIVASTGISAGIASALAYVREILDAIKKSLFAVLSLALIIVLGAGCAIIRVDADGSYTEKSLANGICLKVAAFGSLGHCELTGWLAQQKAQEEEVAPREIIIRILTE